MRNRRKAAQQEKMKSRDSDKTSPLPTSPGSCLSLSKIHSDGVLVVDKPAGISSAGMVARVKKLLGAKKVGHAGTLDPFATGVLVCCVNQGTRLARFFLHGEKKYEAVLELGIETDTQDLTGTVTSKSEDTDFDERTIREIFERFQGEIRQHPPVYSALKHEGTPLYKLARQGKAVQKPPRQVFISHLRIIDIKLSEIRFETVCSGGTYIRTLAADIGAALGCGAHLKSLRRLESSGFSIMEAIHQTELEERKQNLEIISMAHALRGMPRYVADELLGRKIKHGTPLTGKDISLKTDSEVSEALPEEVFVKVTDAENNLLAVLTPAGESGKYKYCCVFHGQS